MLDSDAELSGSAACLPLACSATVVSPSILLALQTAHGVKARAFFTSVRPWVLAPAHVRSTLLASVRAYRCTA